MTRRRWLAVLAVLIVAAGAGGLLLRKSRERPTVVIVNLGSIPILDASVSGIKEGLREEGLSGDRLRIVDLNANMDMNILAALAREALAADPTVVIPVSTPVSRAIVSAPRRPDQRIVYSTVTSPAALGADTVTNMTGVADVVNYDANINLIFTLFPQTHAIGMVYNPGESNSAFGVKRVEELARARGFRLVTATVASSGEVRDAVSALLGQVDVIYIGSDNTVASAIAAVTSVCYERGVPVIASDVGSVEEGALAAVSVDYHQLGKQVGHLVARMIRDKQPARDVPPVRFLGNSLVLNENAARQLKFAFPDSVRRAAPRVIPATR